MSPIVHNARDIFEVRNAVPVPEGEDPPTMLAELGDWRTPQGQVSGVVVSTFGNVAPILSANEARKFGRWLQKAADELEGGGQTRDRPGSKRSHYEQDDDA